MLLFLLCLWILAIDWKQPYCWSMHFWKPILMRSSLIMSCINSRRQIFSLSPVFIRKLCDSTSTLIGWSNFNLIFLLFSSVIGIAMVSQSSFLPLRQTGRSIERFRTACRSTGLAIDLFSLKPPTSPPKLTKYEPELTKVYDIEEVPFSRRSLFNWFVFCRFGFLWEQFYLTTTNNDYNITIIIKCWINCGACLCLMACSPPFAVITWGRGFKYIMECLIGLVTFNLLLWWGNKV